MLFSEALLINLWINSLSNDVKLTGLIRDSGDSQQQQHSALYIYVGVFVPMSQCARVWEQIQPLPHNTPADI